MNQTDINEPKAAELRRLAFWDAVHRAARRRGPEPEEPWDPAPDWDGPSTVAGALEWAGNRRAE